MKILLEKTDILGAISSSLCILHCLATPFIFIAQAGVADAHDASPFWWNNIDYILLAISLFAVYKSAQMTISTFVKRALWVTWSVLFLLILNEKLEVFHLEEYVTYIVAFTLSILHVYNFKYCQCEEELCCGNDE